MRRRIVGRASTVAAAIPMMFTSLLKPSLMIPANGCGSGVGTGPPADGTITICVSIAVI